MVAWKWFPQARKSPMNPEGIMLDQRVKPKMPDQHTSTNRRSQKIYYSPTV